MPLYLEPHSEEWFNALKAFNPMQAAQTEQIIKLAGNSHVCSVCGDDPAKDYKLVASNLPEKAVATIRLCDDCVKIRGSTQSESYAPFP